jgi:hypothetical protein
MRFPIPKARKSQLPSNAAGRARAPRICGAPLTRHQNYRTPMPSEQNHAALCPLPSVLGHASCDACTEPMGHADDHGEFAARLGAVRYSLLVLCWALTEVWARANTNTNTSTSSSPAPARSRPSLSGSVSEARIRASRLLGSWTAHPPLYLISSLAGSSLPSPLLLSVGPAMQDPPVAIWILGTPQCRASEFHAGSRVCD